MNQTDRQALIKLASSLPKGSPERKAILSGVKQASPSFAQRVRAVNKKWEELDRKLTEIHWASGGGVVPGAFIQFERQKESFLRLSRQIIQEESPETEAWVGGLEQLFAFMEDTLRTMTPAMTQIRTLEMQAQQARAILAHDADKLENLILAGPKRVTQS